MDNATEQPPIETTEAEAHCASCGAVTLRESVVVGANVPIPYRKVTGTFVQFVDAQNQPLGPWWACCDDCGKNPLELPEVQAAYAKLTGEVHCH